MDDIILEMQQSTNLVNNNEKQIFSLFDWLRFPLVLGVVFIHCFGEQLDFSSINFSYLSETDIYNLFRISISHVGSHICVPLFFFISGYLFFVKLENWNNKIYVQKLKRRVKTILVPYLLWNLIKVLFIIGGAYVHHKGGNFLVDYFSHHGVLNLLWNGNEWNTDRYNFFGLPIISTSPIMFQLWYLRDLMVMCVLAPLFYYGFKYLKASLLIFVGICFLLGIQIPLSGFSNEAILFFGLGSFVRINNIDFTRINAKLEIVIYLFAFLLWIFCTAFDGHNTRKGEIIYPLWIIAGSLSFMLLSFRIAIKKQRVMPQILITSTFFIYLSHTILIELIQPFFIGIVENKGILLKMLEYTLFPIIVCSICILIYMVMKKFLPRTTQILIGGR